MLDKNEEITMEVVAHYPDIYIEKSEDGEIKIIKEDPNSGTFHVYWAEMEMDLRGCRYHFKSENELHISLPRRKSYDKEAKKEVFFTDISFVNSEYNTKFVQTFRECFEKYAKANSLTYRNSENLFGFQPSRFTRYKKKIDNKKNIKPTGTFKKFVDFKDRKIKIN